MKKASLVILATLNAFLLTSIQTGCTKAPSAEELKASMEILDVQTYWTKKLYSPWPPKLVLVPAISFRVKNLSDKPLRYVNFNAIFRYEGLRENLGDRFMPALAKPLKPGEMSDVILLKSNLGVEGKNLNGIKNNPEWKNASVKLFIQSKGSRYILFGEWSVSRDIDFKEPEPLPPPKKEEKHPSL